MSRQCDTCQAAVDLLRHVYEEWAGEFHRHVEDDPTGYRFRGTLNNIIATLNDDRFAPRPTSPEIGGNT